MPRSKRRTATFGDGISTSTATSRRVTHGIKTLAMVSRGSSSMERRTIQDGHEHCKPQLLCADEGMCIGVPFAALDVVKVAQDHKDPSHLEEVSKNHVERVSSVAYGETQPPNEAVMLFKHIVVGTSRAVSHCQRSEDSVVLTCESKGKRSRRR
jgi:hypothetical protein